MLNLAEKKKKFDQVRSISEIMPWLIIFQDDYVLNKDGSVLACFEIDGVDVEGRTRVEIDSYASAAEAAFRELTDQITIWSSVKRRKKNEYLDGALFRDEFSKWVDDCWRYEIESGELYANKHYVNILYTPRGGADGLFDRVGYFAKRGLSMPKAIVAAIKTTLRKDNSFAFEASKIENEIASFDRTMDIFQSGMESFGLRRIRGDELRGFLHDAANPATEGQQVRASKIATYLDTYIPDNQVRVHEDLIEFRHNDKKWVAALSVKDWPDVTYPGMIDELLATPAEITISQVFRFVDDGKAEAFITKMEKHNLASVKSVFTHLKEGMTKEESNQVNTGRLQLAEDAQDALRELTAERKRFGYYNLTILCYGDSREQAQEAARQVDKTLRRNQFVSVRETLHLQSAWAGTLPGQWGELVRWHFVNIGNLADLAHFRTIHIGPESNAHLTEEMKSHHPSLTMLTTELATPFYYNFHCGDLGHAFVIGPSGNGKSIFCNFLISQFRKYPKSNVFIFDKDYSCYIPTLLQGGGFLDLLGEKEPEIRLNPLRFLGDETHWPWIKSWLEILLSYRNRQLTSEDDAAIQKAISMAAAQPSSNWRLQTVSSFLPQDLSAELKIWCQGGQYGRYFDNLEDEFSLGDFVAIEMGGLTQQPILAIAFLEYAFYSILLRLDGTPTLIEIEECWFMLSFPHLADKIRDWLKTFRKKNAFVVMATQSLDDLQKSTIFSSIIDNVPTRIYLPNPNVNANYDLYHTTFSLNEAQIERIRSGRPKRNYYITQPGISRMVDVSFPKEILAVMRSNTSAIDTFIKHRSSGGVDWKSNYIKEMQSS